MNEPPEDRRYDDEETALILRRAVEIQSSSRAGREGLTLRALQEIAAEVGIDPEAVARAAGEVDLTTRRSGHPLLGGPTSFQFERRVEGTLTPEDHQAMVDEIRRVMGRHGLVDQVLGALEWKARDPYGGTFVTAAPEPGGGTRIRVIGVRHESALVTYSLAGLLTLVLGVTARDLFPTLDPGAMVLYWTALVTGGWTVTRGVWRRISNRWRNRLTEVTDRLAALVAEAAQTRLGPGRSGGDQSPPASPSSSSSTR